MLQCLLGSEPAQPGDALQVFGEVLDPARLAALQAGDLTAYAAAQEELGQALAGQVFETASEGIMLTDAQNRIISVNPAFEAITGYAALSCRKRNARMA